MWCAANQVLISFFGESRTTMRNNTASMEGGTFRCQPAGVRTLNFDSVVIGAIYMADLSRINWQCKPHPATFDARNWLLDPDVVFPHSQTTARSTRTARSTSKATARSLAGRFSLPWPRLPSW